METWNLTLLVKKSCRFFALLALTGCVSSIEPDVELTPSPAEDKDYFDALQKATRERIVFKDFETRMIVGATYLSPEFRSAFAQRLERVYKKGEGGFQEAKEKAGFFVTIDVPGADSDSQDIANGHHWTVLLKTPEGSIRPVVIKRITDKERWRAFFKNVTNWTSEYLVIFDVPSVNPDSPKMVAKTPVQLMLANADAQLNLSW